MTFQYLFVFKFRRSFLLGFYFIYFITLLKIVRALKISYKILFVFIAGVYQSGASNKAYVDYVYVGGSQNPMSEVITNGNVSFITYLPHGSYDIRYL